MIAAIGFLMLALLWLRPRLLAGREAARRVRALRESADDEATVIVEGLLVTPDETLCEALDDGARVAASSLELSDGRTLLRRRAAGRLWIERSDDAVPLEGDVEVVVGDVETFPLVGVQRLHPTLASRMATQLDEVPKGAVRFRSLSSGTKVVARGRADREMSGGDDSYRDKPRAAIVLTADDGPIRLAAVERPKVCGAWMACLTGVRRRADFLLPAGALVTLSSAAALALVAYGSDAGPMEMSDAIIDQTPVVPSVARKLHGQACLGLEKRYAQLVDDASGCSAHADCIAQKRGGPWFALDGCARILGDTDDIETIDGVAREWIEGGCAYRYAICEPPPDVQCVANRCVERPPDPIPATWHREEVLNDIWFYVPPHFPRGGPNAHSFEDSIGRVLESPRMDLIFDYGRNSGIISRKDDPPETRRQSAYEDVQLGGVTATLRRGPANAKDRPFGVALSVEEPPCASAECARYMGGGATLFVSALCDTQATCDEAEQVVRSIRFRSTYANSLPRAQP